MPWENKGIMSLREEFIAKVLSKMNNLSQLCREYNISRPTAYKWLSRFEEEGKLGLYDRSRRPSHMPTKKRDNFTNLVILLRDTYPSWGAKKLRQVLINEGHKNLPSLSTFNRILKEQEKISKEFSNKSKQFIRFEKENPNELWQMDFKGYFSITEGDCHPLTVLDDYSRFAICLRACVSETEKEVREGLEEAFGQYGLPEAMTMDNGSPWKGYPKQRLSSITVWLMRLGIKVSHSRPRHPQTQGKDERFHRTFKDEVLKYHNFENLKEAQQFFNEWRQIYNEIRPHEGIDMLTPAQKYRRSGRSFCTKLPEIEYTATDEIKKVGNNGEICFKGKRQYVGSFLKGEYVALRQRKEYTWDIYYFKSRIGGINLKENNERKKPCLQNQSLQEV